MPRLHIPIRCANLIDAPETAVRRALRRTDVWSRAATAVGGRLESSGSAPTLQSGQLIRFHPGRHLRSVLLRVAATELPSLESAFARGGRPLHVGLTVAPTAAGCLTTVEFRVDGPLPLVNSVFRPALIRYGEMFLGIAQLAAGEPVRVVAGAVIADGHVLLARRRPTSAGPGQWELPGGKVEPGETDEEALVRELFEELTLHTRVSGRIGPAVEFAPGQQLFCYRAELTHDQDIGLVDHQEYRWVAAGELGSMDLLTADRELIGPLREALRVRP